MTTRNYEDLWRFWLDDACYRVARGARYLDEPSDVSKERWEQEIAPAVRDLEDNHKVRIRYQGNDDGGTVQVARHHWVFELADQADHMGDLGDALYGVLLGYDADSINSFLMKKLKEGMDVNGQPIP